MKWLLLIMLVTSEGGKATKIDSPSEEHCNQIRTELIKNFKGMEGVLFVACLKKKGEKESIAPKELIKSEAPEWFEIKKRMEN